MKTNRIRIILLGTSLAVGTIVGLAPMGPASAEIIEAERRTVEQPVIDPATNPGVDPCDLVGCDDDGPIIDNPDIDPCDLVGCDKPVIDNPNIDPCDLVTEACTDDPGTPGKPGRPGQPGTPSTNPDTPVKATVAFTG